MSGAAERVLTGRHVLWGLIAFFGLICAANAVLVWLAVDSFPGRTGADPYREGLTYNRVLAARDAQRARGWRADVRLETAAGGAAVLSAGFRDHAGRPLGGLAVTGTLRRPATTAFDRPVRLAEVDAGIYRMRLVPAPPKGQWLLALEAHGSGGGAYATERRLWLK